MFTKYIIQYTHKKIQKISSFHFEIIVSFLFVEWTYIDVTNSLDKIKKPIFHSKFKVYILIRKGNKKK